MKKLMHITLLATGVLFSNLMFAQKVQQSQVPSAVTAELHAKYPQAAKVTWEKEKGNFEANWGGKSGEDISVMFTPAGKFVEQVQAITASQLPAAATVYIKTHYRKAKVDEAGKIIDAAGKIFFEAEIKGKELVFDEKGNFVKTEKE
ncbi:hypothetical protein CKK33_02050 [Mucilaginibacter sp. MD40]|uniref:PepSY-like domain-containing protein n=1 Tax=Mucilaginibacter sp. MD40 TaxID=2029590 RepID=UPI000BACEA22|nr:PepSY-like domain-containing protein [Mucilaginibacter sp. MD40]PAW92338.1 hypothetical protein CKK33_02050 [Mucilaginibacter sp. MD40]